MNCAFATSHAARRGLGAPARGGEVRAAPEQVERKRLRDARAGVARGRGLEREAAVRALARQRRDLVARQRDRALELGELGPQHAGGSACARASWASVSSPPATRRRVSSTSCSRCASSLPVDFAQGEQPLQLEVGARHARGEREPRRIRVGTGGEGLGVSRRDRGVVAMRVIELVVEVDRQLRRGAGRARDRRRVDARRGEALARDVQRAGEIVPAPCHGRLDQRLSAPDAGRGDRERRIRAKRFVDQRIELGIFERRSTSARRAIRRPARRPGCARLRARPAAVSCAAGTTRSPGEAQAASSSARTATAGAARMSLSPRSPACGAGAT